MTAGGPAAAPTAVARGRAAEAEAAALLGGRGYHVVACNHRCRGGEVDLVAWDGAVLCFVEVRARADAARGHPLETVDRRKQRRIARAAADYLARVPAPWPPMRFDVVGILGGAAPETVLVRDAFQLGG